MKAAAIQNSFNAGEISPWLKGRTDLDKYKNGLATCLNAVPTVYGAVTRRPGTYYVGPVKTESAVTRLIPFVFNTAQAYVMEFGNGYIRFFTDHGQLQITPGSAWNILTIYARGDLVTYGGVNYQALIANLGCQPDLSPLVWHAFTGTIYDVATPYATSDLSSIKFAQSNDMIYLAAPGYAPRKLARYGSTDWRLDALDPHDGPYLNVNATDTTMTAAYGGAYPALAGFSITLALSTTTGVNDDAGFQATDSGRLVRVYDESASLWLWVQISSVVDTTHANANIRGGALSAASTTTKWRMGVWSVTTGYPTAVTFFENRLVFGGGAADTQRIDGSVSADYENFQPTAYGGSVADDNAYSFSLAATDSNSIQWLQNDEKALLAGTYGGEWAIRSASSSSGITPTSVDAKQSSNYGSAAYQPVRSGRSILYLQKSQRKLRELAYSFDVDGYESPDMTLLSEHITQNGLSHLTHQLEPFSIVWSVRGDGLLIGFTFDRKQDVLCWHRHQIGGVSDANGTNAVVESIAVIPEPNGTYDELWMIVKRRINGAVHRYVEYMTAFRTGGEAQADAFFVDCGLTYSGAAATTISGLGHLEGQTVMILADGATTPDQVVSGGAITLPTAATKVHVGLAYNSDIEPLRMDAGAANGTSMGKLQRANRVVVKLFESLGLQYGGSFDSMDTFDFRSVSDLMGAAVPLFTGDIVIDNWPGDLDRNMRLCFRQAEPLPLTIVAIMPTINTEDAI